MRITHALRLSTLAVFLTPIAIAACGPSRESPSIDVGDDRVDAGTQVDQRIDAAPIEGEDPPPPAVDIDVSLTADNAYSFGYGDENAIATFFQGSRAGTAGQIFNCGEGPEHYFVSKEAAPIGSYLYVASWDDYGTTQGILGQFTGAGQPSVYTGSEVWEVCATGIDMQASQTGPTQTDLNAQIAICNAGTGDPTTTSSGWVNSVGAVTAGAVGHLAVGEDNTNGDDRPSGNNFVGACTTGAAPPGYVTIDQAAHWMWYSPDGFGGDPFDATGSNTFRAYLIFRLAGEDVSDPGPVE